ncbi:MAG: DUF58 domain-containing protein [Anaerovoracaceae bacterium]|nr:DUF58 domain-containing protein [Bacillota bacterium]MCG4733609.1 DUF58 domain-containing protein [Casaltella massiliensis]
MKKYNNRMRGLPHGMNAAGRKAVSLTSVFILLAFVFLFTTAYYAAVPLICFAVLLAVSAASGFLPGRRLEYTVESEGRSEKEKPLVFFVTVKNSGVLPVFSVSITVVLRNKFTEEERRERIITAVGPRAKKTVKMMTEEKHCGCVEASIEEAYISDPLGIFGRKRTSTACGSTDILPSERAAAADSRIFSSFNSESFKYSKYRKGNDPGEIQGIRDYRIGDSPKTIHWKLSGKMDDIMVRELGYPVENDILLIFDNAQSEGVETSDKKMSVFVSVALELLRRGIPHSMGWYDRDENYFFIMDVNTEEQVWNVISRILRSAVKNDNVSAIARFIDNTEEYQRDYSQYIYVSDDNRDIERLMEYGKVSTLGTEEIG